MPEEPDNELVRLVARGDRDALGALYDRFAPALTALGCKMLGGERETEDVLHDVFLEVWRRAGDYDSRRGSVKTWLFVRMRSRCLDRIRSKQSRVAAAAERDEEDLAASSRDPTIVSDALRLRDAMTKLPPEQNLVLELGYFEGLSCSQIAERLEIPIGTVKSRVAAGLQKLRVSLGAVEEAS